MSIYHTVQLTENGTQGETVILDLETKESYLHKEDLFDAIDTFNKRGYRLAGIMNTMYYMTKRVD